MAYVPNPNDATQPLGSVAAQTAAAEFRALKAKVNNLQGTAVTWNPADASSTIGLSGGNLITTSSAFLSPTAFASVRGTTVKNTGSWYYEVTFTDTPGATVGLATINSDLSVGAGNDIFSWGLATVNGSLYNAGAILGTIAAPIAATNTVGIGYNLDTGNFTIISPAGTTVIAAAGIIGLSVYPIISISYLTAPVVANFGTSAFTYTIPAGHLALYQQDYSYNENSNLLVNGDCVIDQQNAGALQNPIADGEYMVDGWLYKESVAGKFQAQQNLFSTTPPAGYSKYQGLQCIAAYVPAAGEAFYLEQRIEGYNTVPLAFGNAAADPLTLFFKAYSSVVGTHSGALTDGGNTRVYPFTFTITTANTWTNIAVVIPGDIAGTWNALTDAPNMKLRINLGAVSTRLKAATGWQADATDTTGVTGAVSIVGTLNATFYYTGVELRRGVYASNQPREMVPIEQALAKCLRYYYKSPAAFVITGNATGAGVTYHNRFNMPVPMRIAPVVSTTFSALVNCTTAIVTVTPYQYGITLLSGAAGNMSAQYDAGNTLNARL